MAMANPNRVYEDFEPPSDLVKEQDCDTILIYLPGFSKEQLKVQLTPTRVLKVSGERPTGEKKWRRFQKEFVVSTNCDTKEITAKFEGGILFIRQPKLITPAPPEQKQQVVPEPKPDHKPPVEAPVAPPHQPLPQPQSQPQHQARPELQPAAALIPPYPEVRAEERKEEENARISNKGKEHVRKYRGESSAGQKQEVVAGVGLFKELRNSDNQKRLAVYVLMMILVAFYVLQLFKSLTRIGQKTVTEYDEEL